MRESEEWTKSQAWGYATLANTLITMVAVAGIGIIICTKRLSKSTMQLIFDFFIALGVSTMLASALLHFLPEVLGIETEEGYIAAVGKLSVVIAVIYIFWLFEQVTHMLGHEHSHGEFEEDQIEAQAQTTSKNAIEPAKSESDVVLELENQGSDEELKAKRKRNRSAILGILVGDSVHNFVDGVAIGVSWAQSWETGLATSLAIFLHELPHELADFTIYINFGLSNVAALAANTFSAIWSYGGLYLGLALSENTDASAWLMACVIGLFLYIPFVDILPELKIKKTEEKKWLRLAIQNIGMLGGFVIMAVIGIAEGG